MQRQLQQDLVTGNYFDKYRSSNPLHQLMVGGFLSAAQELLAAIHAPSVIEVGCGPGDLAARLFGASSSNIATYVGTDICELQIAEARRRYPLEQYPHFSFSWASAYALAFPDQSFDLCVACEVLEHLDRPAEALAEIARVTRRYILVSVPWEPVWRILNCMRGHYLTAFGNTPGHVQHFSRRSIRRLVSDRFNIIAERRPFPWTMLLAERSENGVGNGRPKELVMKCLPAVH